MTSSRQSDRNERGQFNQVRENAVYNLFALLGVEEPTEKQWVIAERLIENVTEYARSRIGH